MKNHLLRNYGLLSKRKKNAALSYIGLSSVVSFLEILSISAVIPFLGVLLDPHKVYEYSFVAEYANRFGVSNPLELTLPVTVIFISAVLISGVLKILLLWGQIRLGHSIGADISYRIFRSTIYQDYLTHMSKNSSDVLAAISEKTNSIITQIVFPIIQLLGSLFLILMLISAMHGKSSQHFLRIYISWCILFYDYFINEKTVVCKRRTDKFISFKKVKNSSGRIRGYT